MKVVKANIFGEERILANTLRVSMKIAERFGSEEAMRNSMASGSPAESIGIVVDWLAMLMEAGDRYADLNGIYNPTPLSADELLDNCGVNDLIDAQKYIQMAMEAGMQQDVVAEGGRKNAETTQDQ